jgi:7-keto-8-aminopelargonate synthetase-like enzyme
LRTSGAQKQIFRHNDVDHLESLLRQAAPDCFRIIAFESLYSMDGDVAPLARICDLADRFDALTYLDELHAVGLCRKALELLLEQFAIYLQPINYPTVPKGTEWLRITPTPYHDDRLIRNLAAALCEIWEHLHLPLAVGEEGPSASEIARLGQPPHSPEQATA